MRAESMKRERGQVLIIVALGLFLVTLGASALAVDWGNGLLKKRRLQAVADAAALAAATELSRGGSVSGAVTEAQAMVSSSTGGTVSLAYPGTGAGTGLSDGIDITIPGDIRVALVRQVDTMFAPIFGVNTLDVRARSRASTGPYGVLPISVKRFSAGNTAFPLGQGGNPSQVLDHLAPARDAAGNINYISSWPSPLTTPGAHSAGFTRPESYDPRVSGPVMPLIGHDALANVANGNDFHFFVAPDVRQITSASPVFYNGITGSTSIQQLKDIESSYFLAKGYPGPNPVVGEQLGALNGTNTAQTVDAMRKVYRRGDVVVAMVYDGTVYRRPEFDISVDAAIKSSSNIGPAGSPLTFQVTLMPRNNFNSPGVEFSATGLDGWADWRFESASLNTPHFVAVSGSSVTLTFTVSSTSAVEGARTALIRARDPATGNMRTASATLVVGSVPAFSLSCAGGYQVVEQKSKTRFDLDLRGWNGYPTTNVTIDPVEWFTSGTSPSPTSAPTGVTVTHPSTVQVRDGKTSALSIDLDAAETASTGEWMIRLRARDGDSTRNQEIYLTVRVILHGTGPTAANTTSFVQVLGYASFMITYADNAATPSPSKDGNTIYCYAVSPLVSDPSLLEMGTGSRLIGWNQTR